MADDSTAQTDIKAEIKKTFWNAVSSVIGAAVAAAIGSIGGMFKKK